MGEQLGQLGTGGPPRHRITSFSGQGGPPDDHCNPHLGLHCSIPVAPG